jgi:hypothetical protein
MRFIEGEMTRCASSAGCNENDHPMKKHVTLKKFPWNIERIAAELDAEVQVIFKYVTTPRYERQ